MTDNAAFPRRQLGTQSLMTPTDLKLDIERLTLIALSNFIPGDVVNFPKGDIEIVTINREQVGYTFISASGQRFNEVAQASNITTSALFQGVKALLPTLAPDYQHALCSVVERDPAIFRRQDQLGWVICDALPLSLNSGNVVYPIGPGSATHSISEEEAFTPVSPRCAQQPPLAASPHVDNTAPLVPDTTQKAPIQQGAFDF